MNLGNLVSALRRCSRCKNLKPLSDFYRRNLGIQGRCKICVIQAKAEWRIEQRKKMVAHEALNPVAERFNRSKRVAQ